MSATTWDELDERCAPRASAAVARVDVAGEAVLYDPVDGRALVLNATGTTVWNVLDGDVTIAGLADEVADIYDLDAGAVRDQLVDLVRELGRLGLLDGVVGAGRETPTEGC